MASLFTRRKLLGATGAAALVPLALTQRATAVEASATTNPAGLLVTLRQPERVFDSRKVSPTWTGTKLLSGNTIGVPLGGHFGGAIGLAAFINVTITGTTGSGFLVVRPSDATGDVPLPDTSNINWTAAGVTTANLTLVAVGFESYIQIAAVGGGSTHVIIDLQGYVPFIG
jgi:hypothetical protein